MPVNVNKVLLPNNAGMDFAPGGGSIGWVPMTEGNTLLSVAENIIRDGNADNLEDHAIPSPIAYVKHFKHKLDHDDPDAISEWRGMLAAIALQKVKSLNITIKDIPIFPDPDTGNPTVLGKVLCEELVSNSDITGYEMIDTDEGRVPNYKTLSVFCKDGIPFAMFMPSMLICPFKYYPIDLFSDLQWYNYENKFAGDNNKDPKGTWLPVRKHLDIGTDLSVTAKCFYFWTQNVQNIFTEENNVKAFKEDILGKCDIPAPDPSLMPVPGDYGNAGKTIPQCLKDVCPFIKISPFTKKVLFIIPQSEMFDGEDFSIDKNGTVNNIATPMKRFFFGADAPVYVIPPFTSSLIGLMRDGEIELTSWRFDRQGDRYKCELIIKICKTGQIARYEKIYETSDVTWTEAMPYISLWPYVNFADDSWKEHYVAVCANNEGLGGNLTNYDGFVSATGETQHLLGKRSVDPRYSNCPIIEISLVAKRSDATICTYKCKSPFKGQEFKLISGDSQPFALGFSYTDAGVNHEIGSWIIDRKGTDTPAMREDMHEVKAEPDKTYYVAMDFGTTSTNVYLREDGSDVVKSISSAGKYLHNIYNPYAHKTHDGKCESAGSDFIQNYYLFSDSSGEMGKIFTYGQNFTADRDGIPVGETISNVSGRMIAVDETFILEGTIGSASGIWNGLKMRWGDDGAANASRTKATENFISNVLTYAVLEAKAEGASNIKLRVSYPDEQFGDVVTHHINNIKNSLESKSGLGIELRGATEAEAAGEFFRNAPIDYEKLDGKEPSAEYGYAIVDIGGGTTDFSFWKGEPKATMKAKHSFGYAGNFLIERTIIQGIRNTTDFSKIWKHDETDTNSIESRAITRYKNINVPVPIGPRPIPDYYQKVATIDFLLETCSVNAGILANTQYKDFLAAVRMKYYSLFMLIASYIKKQAKAGIIEINPINFRICLAGCGAKGMSFARMGPMGEYFDEKLSKIFEKLLGINKGNFAIVGPVTDNKEEVVIGLTYVIDGEDFGDDGNVDHTTEDDDTDTWGDDDDTDTPTVAEITPAQENVVDATYEELENAYNKLIKRLADLELPHGADNKPIHNGTSLVDRINCRYPKVKDYFASIFAKVKLQARQANPNQDTFADTFALLMLETMIDHFI